jgi:hypothetical protein
MGIPEDKNRYINIRTQIKTLVDNKDYQTAKTTIQNILNEINNRYPDADTTKGIIYGEKITIRHALNHLNAVIDKNDPSFIDFSNGEVKHQSDIVKDTLLYTPKMDYSD